MWRTNLKELKAQKKMGRNALSCEGEQKGQGLNPLFRNIFTTGTACALRSGLNESYQ